ncbi:MAG: tRNA uridine-5-carboxymethylaminomethyl(34) synthesis GTPase MnmE [Anaerolineae bacterium]|nr:tRNA uridine-5-carboxymethylaminomethyl(34) synthesis GTPase MnmE [Anaerolineae bacterium]
MYSLDDTIAAISTPIGEGGIGIVRMTGPLAADILSRIFCPGRKRPGTSGERQGESPYPLSLIPYHLHYGHVVDPQSEETVDEVLVSYMPAPRTYTCEDVVEINCHGGVVPLRRVLELTLRHGARLAQPGEMTLRAFLNGRIDLAQAEAVLDIVQAKTEASLRVAVEQLGGRLSNEIRVMRAFLMDVLAYLEATIDFEEDEIPFQDIGPSLREAIERLEKLLANADRGIIYRQGVRTAIVGRPNVGKSSLLNALLRTSRAIVTPIPGTTRDTLEETVNLKGIPLVLVDTAGITAKTDDAIEKLGIERSRAALAQADLALLVIDGSEPLQSADSEIADLVGDKPAIVVINKVDLTQRAESDGLLPQADRVSLSALTGQGLEKLEEAIVETVFSGRVMTADEPLVSSSRHKDLLAQALDHLKAAEGSHDEGMAADFVAVDLTAAVDALGEITGETATEDLLETIFAKFCIGK